MILANLTTGDTIDWGSFIIGWLAGGTAVLLALTITEIIKRDTK